MNWEANYRLWKEFPSLDAELKKQLVELEKQPVELQDAFYQMLEFGTAGMRGILGIGSNRMNLYTVRQATDGLARLIESKGSQAKQRGVVIAYDSRHQSPEFAQEAANTLAGYGIKVYLFTSLRPTPELSFAVRQLNCVAGIMITASHNPAEYNGYKVYGEDGAQMPPEDANRLTELVKEVSNPLLLDAQLRADRSLITMIDQEIDDLYLMRVQEVVIDSAMLKRMAQNVSLVYTPLHGAGKMMVERSLQQAGFTHLAIVAEQAEADADFSTVVSPNPEVAAALSLAIELAKQKRADLVLATDPDADRLGAAVPLPNGEYCLLTGNQLGALMLSYLLESKQAIGQLSARGVVLKSIVSGELATAICQHYGITMENVLTGFKFIAEKIEQYEADQSAQFLFGFEESYGYLVKPFVRDKDAVQASLLLAEMTAYYKEKGKSLLTVLEELFVQFGYYQEKTISVTMSGMSGQQKIAQLMESLRQTPPQKIADTSVVAREDFLTGLRVADHQSEKMRLPAGNVLKYYLSDDTWIAVRPSGTEPKIKFYLGVKGQSQRDAEQKVAQYATWLMELSQS